MHEYWTQAKALAVRHLAAISQTFFVYNPWTGLVGIVALTIVAPHLAGTGLVVSILARLAAERAGAARSLLDTGLVELNGWFLGLACAGFFEIGPGLLVAAVFGGPLVAVATITLQRLLATWEMPLLVGPYLPAFWLLWSGLTALPWVHAAALPVPPPAPESPLLLVLIGGLRGIGEIFFLPDALLGLALAVAASIADRRIGPAMIAASVASVGVGYLAQIPPWQIEQGLAGFVPALIAAAALSRFAGLGPVSVGVAVIAAPFIEIASIHLAGALGLYAVSAGYVGFVWLAALLRPVRQAAEIRSGWSMGSRPALFETGGSTATPGAENAHPAVRRMGF